MKKIISIALFGDASRKDGSGMNYHAYASTFVLAHANLFPANEGWLLHIHVDNTTLVGPYGRMLLAMHDADLIKVVLMGSSLLTRSMLWRMQPVFDPNVDYAFCRDVDCVPMPRDRKVCDTFIASNCVVSGAGDSLSHAGLMGGMCGFKCAEFRSATGLNSLDDLYAFAKKSESEWAQHGTDQLVLNRLIDRGSGPTLLEHRYNGWHAGPGKYAARKAGEYRCKSFSTPTPDVGKSRLSVELTAQADLLANHLGAAGYDLEAARVWWERHGDREITRKVLECEAAT